MSGKARFQRVWRFRTLAASELRFEMLYGSRGAWAQLFARHPGYCGTDLQRISEDPPEYIVVDRWASRSDWEAFRHEHAAAYQALDDECSMLTSSEELIREIDDDAG